MVEILDCFFDTVYTLLKGQVDKRTMLDNLELVLLSIDEAVRVVIFYSIVDFTFHSTLLFLLIIVSYDLRLYKSSIYMVLNN